ncbi:FAD dependent oxidoreductase [Aspergillus uvarum CBS 121591]|uniref:FAD dependent oxidoreductase n=1 Tax=Aspergillus uvarum CBS 121591 TaxID=1448315 RepID=A0A319CBB1_9EURO|nr:FAD dependent oxidoreductase [Aspergillus uvarum CBS 121591]PYH81091.1 FAD dependent oxidoreductase [Aspergillus uvarum CBS 121591]
MAIPPSKSAAIVIVGAGVFGLSTALELTRRGYTNITVLDRHLAPVPDGSSVDVSRIIRADYADVFYARMALDALQNGWHGEYAPYFYQSGLMCTQTQGSGEHEYIAQSKQNMEQLGGKAANLVSFQGAEIRQQYPGIHGDLSQASGYVNMDSGWANAELSIGHLARNCTRAGVSFRAGPQGTVTDLLTQTTSTTGKKQVTGVRTASGESISADLVMVSTGAWTPHLLEMTGRSVSVAQPVAFLQLTADEARELDNNRCPVILDLSTGWFTFPPTPGTHLLKIARHGFGYERTNEAKPQNPSSYSAPSLARQGGYLPPDAEKALREGLELWLPRFKDRPFVQRRLCWYSDTPRGDFIVDYHPDYEGLFVATGGSGHAFKFLPVLGRYVADSLELTASVEQRQKWAWPVAPRPIASGDGSRGGPPRRRLTSEERARL